MTQVSTLDTDHVGANTLTSSKCGFICYEWHNDTQNTMISWKHIIYVKVFGTATPPTPLKTCDNNTNEGTMNFEASIVQVPQL